MQDISIHLSYTIIYTDVYIILKSNHWGKGNCGL